jgi:hypothetical protein
MGNNKRPRKLQATNDFPKKKRKLGKRKAIPDNATRVTFKSQSILVPSQLTKPNDEGPSTHRNLTLKVSKLPYIYCHLYTSWCRIY